MTPDCYECKHRRGLVGDAHSRCSIGKSAKELGIKGHAVGINGGWFCWPMNYDPTWLLACNGFESKGG